MSFNLNSNITDLTSTIAIRTAFGEKINQDLALKYGYRTSKKELDTATMEKLFPKFLFFGIPRGEPVRKRDVVVLTYKPLH